MESFLFAPQPGDQKTLYLDKLVTNPHIPRRVGQNGFSSTTSLPDLSHTGIETKFQPKSIVVFNKRKNMLTPQYKLQAYDRMRTIQREYVAAHQYEKTFTRAHKQFIDKVLVEMDSEKRLKLDKTIKSFRTGKDKLGFTEEFNFFSEDKSVATPTSEKSNKPATSGVTSSFAKSNRPPSMNMLSENSAVTHQDEKQDSPVVELDAVGNILNNNVQSNSLSTKEQWDSFLPQITQSTLSRDTRETLSIENSRVSTGANEERKKKLASSRGWVSSAEGKQRVYNRMTQFTKLLNESHAPRSRTGDRYGALKGPVPTTR